MSDTPETNAQIFDACDGQGCEAVLAGFARKLERERDDARKLAESSMFEADRLRGRLARLEQERDDAQAQYRSTHTLAEVMVKSRNEFLEALRDIAKMDTSQEASGGQCAAVWRAMEALK